jgi:UDP-glucose 4-epimerase
MTETMKCLVTGGAGFMGSWLVDELLKRGHSVVNIDNLSGGYERNVSPGCMFIKADLRNFKTVDKAMKGIDIIYHLAAYAAEGQSVFSPIQINDINITPMNNLLVAAINNNVKKFVFTSSMAVYGDQNPPFDEGLRRKPVDPYGAGKTYCEEMLEIFLKAYGLGYTIIRPHNVYGPRQNIADPYRNVLGIWMNRIMNGQPPLIYGDGEQTRAFSYVGDITPPLANAGFFEKADNQIINLGSDEVVSINQACGMVLEAMESDIKPKHADERPCEVKHAHCTVEKSIKLLGYKTTFTLMDGIKKMHEWAKTMGHQKPTYTLPLEIEKNAPEVWRKKLI